jgi:hypothetical protein
MSARDVFDILPESVWNLEPDSVSRSRWNAFADGLDEIADVATTLAAIRFADNLEGTLLDDLGEIFKEPREGKTDAEYRRFIRIAIFRQKSNGSAGTLSAIGVLVLGDEFRGIRNMYPDITPLDGNGVLDGTGTLSGVADFRPEDALMCDGSVFASGEHCASGHKQRLKSFECRYSAAVNATDESAFKRIMQLAAPAASFVQFYQEP